MASAATQKAAGSPSVWAQMDASPPTELIFGQSAAMQAIQQKIEKFAGTSVPVLIQGDSGTGKGVLARYIHTRSMLANGQFVNVNCAAIPGTLLESELFGYEKGAFTGAHISKPGRVEMAMDGTLFLDGIDEIDLTLQAKLLQLLQDNQFTRIGGQSEISVRARVICSTAHSLEEKIDAGRFRPDLYYRINVVNVELPPLRTRAMDITALTAYFLERHQRRHKTEVRPLSSALMKLLEHHPWPGNIRELENLVERYVILGSEEALSAELLQWERAQPTTKTPNTSVGPIHLKKATRKAVQELERKIILSALEANLWNRKRAAKELKISYRTLLYKIRQAGLPPKHSSRARRPGISPAQSAVSAD